MTSESKALKNRPNGSWIRGTFIVQGLVVLLLLLNALLLYAIFLSPKGLLGYREQCRQVAALEEKVLKLKKENQKLYNNIRDFKSDPHAQERLIRQQLGWVREGDLMVEFLPSGKEPPGH